MADDDNYEEDLKSKKGSSLTSMQRIISYTGKTKPRQESTDDLEHIIGQGVSAKSARISVNDADFLGSNGRQQSSSVPAKQMTGLRGYLSRLLDNQHFDLFMGLVIVSNIGVMIVETDKMAACAGQSPDPCEDQLIILVDRLFLIAYTLEALLRIYVLRWRTFHSLWNVLDVVIVALGYVDLLLSNIDVSGMPGPSVSLLRIFRVFRLLRAVRVFQAIPELYAMVRGFISAMQSMFWGFIMVLVLLLLFSVLSVELIHPKSLEVHAEEDYCREAFGTVWHCMIMFFQTLVAGDSWGRCAIPLIKKEGWMFVIFAGALICVQLGFMNLILAVIVERATRAQENDEEEARKTKLKQARKATVRLTNLFKIIDEDGSGTISLDELLDGFDHNKEMQNIFAKLDMTRSDVQLLFELMDTEGEGDLDFAYLIDNLRGCQSDSTKKSLTMLRLQVAEIGRCCKKLHTDNRSLMSPRSILDDRGISPTSADGTSSEVTNVARQDSEDSRPLTDRAARRRQKNKVCRRHPSGFSVSEGPLDLASFEQELKQFRMYLDGEFADLRMSMKGLNETVAPVFADYDRPNNDRSMLHQPSNEVSGVTSSTLSRYSRPSNGSNEVDLCAVSPLYPLNEVSLEDSALNARESASHQAKDHSGPHATCATPSVPQLRLAAMYGDKSLRVVQGPGPGECSL